MRDAARDPSALELLRVQRSRLADRMRPPWWYLPSVAIVWALFFAGPFSSRSFSSPRSVSTWAILVGEQLVDAASRVNSYTSKAGLEGTVLGEGGSLSMEILPKPGVVVAPGEWVLTSGIGGLFPRGILVGQVTQFHRRDSATLEQADLAPAVDFASVSTVLVVIDFVPKAP